MNELPPCLNIASGLYREGKPFGQQYRRIRECLPYLVWSGRVIPIDIVWNENFADVHLNELKLIISPTTLS